MKLKNKTAIITGASHGFGLAVARHFLEQGANVAICGRDAAAIKKAKSTLSTLVNNETKIFSMAADIASPEQTKSFVTSVHKHFGTIDILVANAGIYGTKGPIDKIDWDEWSYAIDVNLKGTVFCCREVLPYMKDQNSGKIIVLSGGGATKPLPTLSAYAASKAGVVRFAETLAMEVKENNIDVNCVAPGALNTRLLDELLEGDQNLLDKDFLNQSLKQKERGGDSLEYGVALCAYLASPESNGITGKLISAIWDPWKTLHEHLDELKNSDIYTLRRIVPKDRGKDWGEV
jgi:NAD(P)-dependent dehydrogenase (short-subunit alcohol dehydrogenase family)